MQKQQKLLLESPAPFLSASNWAVFDRKKGELLFGKCESESKQVASLTKIMTAVCVLDLIERYQTSPWATLQT